MIALANAPCRAVNGEKRGKRTAARRRFVGLLCVALAVAAWCLPASAARAGGRDCGCGYGCNYGCGCGWEDARMDAWSAYAQGEYVAHARLAHVPEYRIRVDDQIDMIYRLTREESPTPYRLNVGDMIRVESFTDADLNRELLLQPDGTITLRLLGQVHATGQTVAQLRDTLEAAYRKYYRVPSITVTPLKVETRLEDLRNTVDRRQGFGGQLLSVKVTPEGAVSLPLIGHVEAQGLTLTELQKEINERYREKINGIEVMPVLTQRAPRYCYVLGEVKTPGRFELTGPTTVLQAISMAGSWNVGANIAQVVVFRRGDDWRLMATMVDVGPALRGKDPCPAGEIWLNDSDVVIVPKGAILQMDDFINLVFTRGIYGVFPMTTTLTFQKYSTL
jgi:polysaccharide export outer membrane protein